MADICGDNRFKLIEKYKQKLLDATNIGDNPEEMTVIDNILFRFWQIGWLDQLDNISRQSWWTPCSERSPEEDGQYIVTVKYEHVDGYEDIYSEHGEWVDGHWDAGFGHCGRVEKVLAWMSLPEPWEGEPNE